MPAISIAIVCFLAPVVVVTAFFGIEVLAGLRPLRKAGGAPNPVTAVIVIPANNEEEVIGRTIAELRRASGDDYRLLVIADNCSDGTADRASAAGAEVLVRTDPDRRGKGYALAAAAESLKSNPPAVVLIIDADCRIDRVSLDALTATASRTGRAAQAVNLLEPQPAGPALVQISTFAFAIKNLVRQRGLQRLARRAHLTGTGMALPWALFSGANLGGSNIVEDLALGLELADRDAAPALVEGATVWSPPANAEGTLEQRKRWEGGYLATSLRAAPKIFGKSLAKGDLRGVIGALDLSIPPLALLVLVNLFALVVTCLIALLGGPIWPLLVQLASGSLAGVALLLAWEREGRRFVSAGTLLRLPLYLLWKLPMYLGLFRRGAPKEWLRSGRQPRT